MTPEMQLVDVMMKTAMLGILLPLLLLLWGLILGFLLMAAVCVVDIFRDQIGRLKRRDRK